MNKFYDTCSLLELQERAFEEHFWCSSVTLQEVERIKTARNKTEDLRYKARNLVRLLKEHQGEYGVVIYDMDLAEDQMEYRVDDTPDAQICMCAVFAERMLQNRGQKMVFVTNDLCCGLIAKNVFGLDVEEVSEDDDPHYTGFKEVRLSEEDQQFFVEHPNDNIFDLYVNQYLLIKDLDGAPLDVYRWDGKDYKTLYKKSLKTQYFDKLKAKDIYQSCAIDSIMNNTITAISGKAGSGKSLISLMCVQKLIEDGKYDRLVVMFNPTKTKHASDMGFYAGSAQEKAKQNSIGHILTTKFGDPFAVDYMIEHDRIKLVSMADIRGMEVNNNEILWITEAQNTSVDLIKLCLSRVSSGAKVIIEGDYKTQVDSYSFEGNSNGLKRVIDVFANHEEFGYIELQNVWRSQIAELCELL